MVSGSKLVPFFAQHSRFFDFHISNFLTEEAIAKTNTHTTHKQINKDNNNHLGAQKYIFA